MGGGEGGSELECMESLWRALQQAEDPFQAFLLAFHLTVRQDVWEGNSKMRCSSRLRVRAGCSLTRIAGESARRYHLGACRRAVGGTILVMHLDPMG
jgi:hypothetical protein